LSLTCASSSTSGRRRKANSRAQKRVATISRGSRRPRPERVAADAGIECIGCGVCYASCDVVGWRPRFSVRGASTGQWTLVNDPRDIAQRERLRAVAGDAGCHSCHTQGSCGERCPKRIEPTAGIAGLKRLAARAAVRGAL
jgi:fumarate reductase iron-sulfur subunit